MRCTAANYYLSVFEEEEKDDQKESVAPPPELIDSDVEDIDCSDDESACSPPIHCSEMEVVDGSVAPLLLQWLAVMKRLM
jgi:hypothetical protein